MSDPSGNEAQRSQAKLGPNTTPGGALGDSNPQTITGVVQVIGPIPNGEYTLEFDVDGYAIQGPEAIIKTSGLSPAEVRQLGCPIIAEAPESFNSDPGDDYVAWVKHTDAADGTNFRCQQRSAGLKVDPSP